MVLEAISGVPDYPLKTADDVARVLGAGSDVLPANVGLLLDVYHLSVNGDDVEQAIATHAARISHVQLADAPGRGLPGTGTLPITTWLDQLAATGYSAGVALEFLSAGGRPVRHQRGGVPVTRIAFIGLGIMGSPMACNLVRAGHDVVGYTRTRAKSEPLVAAGGTATDTLAEAVADAEVIITMLPDSPDVQAVILGDEGVLAHAKSGALIIDMSTIRPAVARMVAEEATSRGFRVLDAPVSGGEQAAIEGTLSIMVGGDTADFEGAQSLLEAVGSTIVHVGPFGAGQTVKAANQLIVAGTIELVSEALVLLDAYGLDTELAVSVLAGGLAGSTVLQRKSAGMRARNFAPGFRVDLHHKDLGIVLETAREAGVAIPLGSATAVLMAALRAQGDGALDHTALLLGVERLSGRHS